MKYIGIDLGTTNSAICSYDGKATQIHKSPEQNDITPSAIMLDSRGRKHIGWRAYNSPNQSDVVKLFKRLMGTDTKLSFKAANTTMNPIECSAEILRTLYGYLPEEMRAQARVVITVPAIFGQMQKQATMEAAQMMGLSSTQVALMQEPVAAMTKITHNCKEDGIFLVYDLGGGTLDITIAEAMQGNVNLLSTGGEEMCGGRDIDIAIMDSIVAPWIKKNFDVPDDFKSNPQFHSLVLIAMNAIERAKIELSQRDSAIIDSENAQLTDSSNKNIYIDIPFDREQLNKLIQPIIKKSITIIKKAIKDSGINCDDIKYIAYIGGPTQYKPLRDAISKKLNIASLEGINPMTAVAEGAAIFAESIDWDSKQHKQKESLSSIQLESNVMLKYESRTTGNVAKIAINFDTDAEPGMTWEVTNQGNGWISGRATAISGSCIEVQLSDYGAHKFSVNIFNNSGRVTQKEEITITRTAATISNIPASHSIGIEVLDKLDGNLVLDYLIKAGDPLPASGKKIFKAGITLKAGDSDALNFRVWEGDLTNSVADNRFIGTYSISGEDFEGDAITAGTELVCSYEILDSGLIKLGVSVPSIANKFREHTFYRPQSGWTDYSKSAQTIKNDAKKTLESLREITTEHKSINANDTINNLLAISESSDADPEKLKRAENDILEAKKVIARIQKDNFEIIRQAELDSLVNAFNICVREHASDEERNDFDALVATAKTVMNQHNKQFDACIKKLRQKSINILHRQPWFLIDIFNRLKTLGPNVTSPDRYAIAVKKGLIAIEEGNMDSLREVIIYLQAMSPQSEEGSNTETFANIIKSYYH